MYIEHISHECQEKSIRKTLLVFHISCVTVQNTITVFIDTLN